MDCIDEHGLENGVEVTGRTADDPQYLGGRGLLLQRLSQFLFQVRVGCAEPVKLSARLRPRRTKTGNARSAFCPLARQGHLVGTVAGPLSVRQPRIGPANPNTTARRTRVASLDHLVGAGEQRRWCFEAEHPGSLYSPLRIRPV